MAPTSAVQDPGPARTIRDNLREARIVELRRVHRQRGDVPRLLRLPARQEGHLPTVKMVTKRAKSTLLLASRLASQIAPHKVSVRCRDGWIAAAKRRVGTGVASLAKLAR